MKKMKAKIFRLGGDLDHPEKGDYLEDDGQGGWYDPWPDETNIRWAQHQQQKRAEFETIGQDAAEMAAQDRLQDLIEDQAYLRYMDSLPSPPWHTMFRKADALAIIAVVVLLALASLI
jgi:hypothetical protein